MTTDEREALVETLWLRDGQHRDHREAQADAIIAHMWSRADDPEVQERVARTLAGIDDAECFYRDQADAAITATLTALIGPRNARNAVAAVNSDRATTATGDATEQNGE